MDTLWQSKSLKRWQNQDLKNLTDVVRQSLDYIPAGSVLCLEGDLGAGKTTFVAALLKQLLQVDSAPSPTYNLVSEYDGPNHQPIYHLDLYRLEHQDELYDLGIESILQQNFYLLLVEWPDVLIPQLQSFYHLAIEKENELRHYHLHKVFVSL